ncbi:hypothetical protein [Muricoccus roseus]|uniref:hypothetical protein n=1 Tax=Muricoccus roseus TaxID=198092 RepID=UPI001114B73E|nr:hypothetical protein [Roseomonas rosea]
MPRRSRTAVAPSAARAGATPPRLRHGWLRKVQGRLLATWRLWSYRPEQHYLRGPSRRDLMVLVLLAGATQAVPAPAAADAALWLSAVTGRPSLSLVRRDGPSALSVRPAFADACDLALERGASRRVFLTSDPSGNPMPHTATMACHESRGVGPRLLLHEPLQLRGPVWFL